MLDRRTTATNNHNKTQLVQRSHHYYHYNQKVCSPLIIGSSNSISLSSSSPLSSLVDTSEIDEISLLEASAKNFLLRTASKSDESNTKLVRNHQFLNNRTVPILFSKLYQNNKYHLNNLMLQKQNRQSVDTKTNILNIKQGNKTNYRSPQVNRKDQQAYKMMNHIFYMVAIILALCALSTTQSFVRADSALQASLTKLKVAPDIISDPSYVSLIKVEFRGKQLKPGDPILAKEFKEIDMSKISWDVNNYEAMHTIVLLDLDRRPGSNNSQSVYNQFTALNIPGNVIKGGQTIVAFETPSVPCHPSSKHRILMLAFHQAQTIDLPDVYYISASSGQSEKRENFKVSDFSKRHRLELVAANVFVALGESNGVCSGSISVNSNIQSLANLIVGMVISVAAFGVFGKRLLVN